MIAVVLTFSIIYSALKPVLRFHAGQLISVFGLFLHLPFSLYSRENFTFIFVFYHLTFGYFPGNVFYFCPYFGVVGVLLPYSIFLFHSKISRIKLDIVHLCPDAFMDVVGYFAKMFSFSFCYFIRIIYSLFFIMVSMCSKSVSMYNIVLCVVEGTSRILHLYIYTSTC